METGREFTDFNLNPKLLHSLSEIGFTHASPIQEMTLEHILEKKDIFAQAETGSGKTGSFAIPIIEHILRREETHPDEEVTVNYIVLSPTRELAQQTHKVFNQLGLNLGVKAACLIGGESIDKQKAALADGTRVLVATPGRLCDLIKQKVADLKVVRAVVFDEADRLFDMGFQKEIEFILSKIDDHRQLIMVSATSNMEVLKTAYKFKSNPMELKLNEDSLVVDHIDHSLAMISADEKMPYLVNFLRNHEDTYAIIFCNTQIQTHLVAEWLSLMNFKAKPISGRLAQNKRTRLMDEFRSKEVTILVCTDVAARGLDIKDVNLVINYDMPQEAANYVHRIGRTGRAGSVGKAISFCAHEDCENLEDIYKLLDAKIPLLDIEDEDFSKDVAKKPYIDGKTLLPVERHQRGRERDRDSKSRSKHERPMNNTPPVNLPPVERTELPPYVSSEKADADRRHFFITTTDHASINRKAAGYFMIKDESLVQQEIIKKGRKKFLLFGPQEITYKCTLQAHYKRLLLPFIIEILKLARIDVMVKVFFKGDTIDVTFNGKDERLFTYREDEMLAAFEQLMRLYLANKITLPGRLRWRVNVKGAKGSKIRESKGPRDRNKKDDSQTEDRLTKLALKIKAEVIEKNSAVVMKAMSARDRRIVHQCLGEDEVVQTTSLGDGRYKKIEVSLR
jgi:ATP-dependent RNA helicase RhlE